jgi:hypothetical protein
MRSEKWWIRNKKLLLTSYFLLLTFIVSCGRRGDPVAIIPYKEVGVVKDLKASIRDNNIYLTWGMPESFPEKALKGFVIFRAEVPEGVSVEECECYFVSLGFIAPDKKRTFEYLDKEAIRSRTHIYKLVVMDKDNRIGKYSNVVLVKGIKPEPEEVVVTSPGAPTGLIAVFTRKNIVLTWDETHGQEIKFYRIYRSEGKDFIAIGESVTPAFTDKGIEPSKKYYYRVTAVGETEGDPSKEIEVVTGAP